MEQQIEARHFNGRFRDESLNETWFHDFEHAKGTIEDWRIDYNEARSHGSLNRQIGTVLSHICKNVWDIPRLQCNANNLRGFTFGSCQHQEGEGIFKTLTTNHFSTSFFKIREKL